MNLAPYGEGSGGVAAQCEQDKGRSEPLGPATDRRSDLQRLLQKEAVTDRLGSFAVVGGLPTATAKRGDRSL